jgi:hypothetical protein
MAGQAPADGEVLMRYLPDDHRYPPPPQWERKERHNRFSRTLLTYIAVLAAGAALWSIARDAFTVPPQPPRIVVMQNAAAPAPPAYAPAAPAPAYGPGRYAQPWDPVGPNLENWGNRARTGVTPRDVFGFASRRDDGGR